MSKPSDELIDLLGLDTPTPPFVSLTGIKPTAITIHWKAGDQDQPKPSGTTYQLHINGVNLGDLSPQEPVIEIGNLRPEHGYVIRIITAAAGGFFAPSDAIRLQTGCLHLEDGSTERDIDPSEDQTQSHPVIRPIRSVSENSSTPVSSAPAMSREHSGSVSQQRRPQAARRSVPGLSTSDSQEDSASPDVQALRNEHVRIIEETEQIKRQMDEEEVSFSQTQNDLSSKKEELRKDHTEKEGSSRKLRQDITRLEQLEKAARTKKTNAEKRLRAKQQERDRLQTDLTKWDQEMKGLNDQIANFEIQQMQHRKEVDEQVEILKLKSVEQAAANRALEEEIQAQKLQIKDLEAEKTADGLDDTRDNPEMFEQEDREAQARMMDLQAQYNQAWQSLEGAKRQHQEAQHKLTMWEQVRNEQPHMFVGSPNNDVAILRKQSQRRTRSSSLRNELSSQAPVFEPAQSTTSFNTGFASLPPSYPSVPSFFSMGNGTMLVPTQTATSMSSADLEQMTGGAPTSPNAGNFLPSDLLSDEPSIMEPSRFQAIIGRPSLDINFPLPGLGAPQTLITQTNQDPNSPVSIPSGSPSALASPQDSNSNLANYPPGQDGTIDSDRRSTRSATGSSRAVSISGNTTSRFTTLFGFNRQRGKTFSDEGPSLGSLRASESQSLPRDASDGFGHRTTGSQSGLSWMGLGSHRGVTSGADSGLPGPKRRFGMFSSKTDSWPTVNGGDKPPSPRPASTNSSESNLLPRPSAAIESRFGWPVGGEGFGQRHSPLATDWAVTAATSWGSRHPSRRPSGQYNVSFSDSLPEARENTELRGSSFDPAPARESPKQAPIGTRPATSSNASKTAAAASAAAAAARLNPDAPAFKAIFLSGNGKDKKAEKASEEVKTPKESRKSRKDKAKEREAEKKIVAAAQRNHDNSLQVHGPFGSYDFATHATPNGHSHHASDARSFSTAGETTSERDSFDRSHQLSPSTTAELEPPNSATRESFMQRLSRKSSASMVLLSGFGKSKKDKNAPPTTPSYENIADTEEVDEEDGPVTPAAKMSTESEKGSPFIGGQARPGAEKHRSGFSFRSLTGTLGKGKKDRSAPSETGDEEESSASVAADE